MECFLCGCPFYACSCEAADYDAFDADMHAAWEAEYDAREASVAVETIGEYGPAWIDVREYELEF